MGMTFAFLFNCCGVNIKRYESQESLLNWNEGKWWKNDILVVLQSDLLLSPQKQSYSWIFCWVERDVVFI